MSGANKIYIVAGERNMLLARAGGGGLYANVGQTAREVGERLRDDDYKRKAAGGRWQVLLAQEVGDSVTDKQIHPLLKSHPGVSWDPDCDNTEEFLFKDDIGDGEVARRIVGEILQQVCVPLLQAEVSRLRAEVQRAESELEQRAQIISGLASGEIVQEAMRRLEESDDRSRTLEDEISRLNRDLQAATSKNEKIEDELVNLLDETAAFKRNLEDEQRKNERLQKEITFRPPPAPVRHDGRDGREKGNPWWAWAIPLAFLSYCGGSSCADSRWETALSREALAERSPQIISPGYGTPTPDKVSSYLSTHQSLLAGCMSQRDELRAARAQAAESNKPKAIPATGGKEGAPSKPRVQRSTPSLTLPLTCTALDRQCSDGLAGCYTNCEGGGRVIRIWGDWLYGVVTLERVGSSLIAEDRHGRKVVSVR